LEINMSRFVKSSLLAIVFAGAAIPATADPLYHAYSVKISVAGLDLDSEAGAQAAKVLIDRAAVKACGKAPSPRNFKAADLHRGCREDFTLKAVQRIGAPVLVALYSLAGPVSIAAK
jgi:UrcA family protein